MKANQFATIFQSIRTRTGEEPPYRVGVLMVNGQIFAGSAEPATPAGLVRIAVERKALAHLTKPPEIVWLDLEAIQAVTDNEFTGAPVPLPAALQDMDSRKDGTDTVEHEGKETHEPQV